MPFNEDEGFIFLLFDLLIVTHGGHENMFSQLALRNAKPILKVKSFFLFLCKVLLGFSHTVLKCSSELYSFFKIIQHFVAQVHFR